MSNQKREHALLQLRSVLARRRDAIRTALQGDLSALQELSPHQGDIAEAALDTAHEEVTSQMAGLESNELELIEQAMFRISEGNFGVCEGCSGDIPLARLQALPYAKLCIECQTKLEESGCSDWSELIERT